METDADIKKAIEIITAHLPIPSGERKNDFIGHLAERINEMIEKDFPLLLSILYRLDVEETKVHQCMMNNGSNAGACVAELIFHRQLQKIKSRQEYRRDNDIDELEKW